MAPTQPPAGHEGATGPSPGATVRRRRPQPGALVVAAIIVLLSTLAAVRFVTASQPDAPPPAVPATLAATITALETRVAADPTDLSSTQSLGIAYVQRAIELGDPVFYDLAARTLDAADALEPDHPTTLVARGTLALSLHEFQKALALGARAHEAAPESAGPLGVLVDAHVELGSYDDAAIALEQMLDRRPDLAALSRVSYLRELSGDLDGAIRAMAQAETAGAGAPFEQATVTALLGNLHLDAGDLRSAAAAYARAAQRSPGLVAAEVGAARVEAARGAPDEAIARLERLVDVRPHPEALLLLAELQRFEGRPEAVDTEQLLRSIAVLQAAAGQIVDLELALFEADRGDDPQAAVALARIAHEARPGNVFVHDALAWALHRSGDSAAAVPHIEAALARGSRDPRVRFHAAVVLAEVGRTDEAREHLEVVVGAPWFSFQHRAEARTLAQQLGVAVPAAWQGAR